MSTQRELDIVLWGATGYTGRLVADRFAAQPRDLRWALGGRDRGKLEKVRDELGRPDLPIVLGDAADPASLAALAQRARVVCTTVGPYAKYGSGLVAACVKAGTHYCDLAGETPWIRQMIDAHHEAATGSGAKIVHCCGFDSIPSDLGCFLLHREARARGAELHRVDAFFGESSGRFSGGTIASLLGVVDEARRDPEIRRVLGNPYGLDPDPAHGGPERGDARGVRWEPRLKAWTAPFLMAAINTRVVRRSNALAGFQYGADHRYTEQMSLPGNARGLAAAVAITGALAGLLAASQIGPLRKLLEDRLPSPGEGPSQEQRERGHFVVRLIGDNGMRAKVADQRDPGYGSTAVMLSESALSLARDPLGDRGGVLTPATAMGTSLIERLKTAGMTFEVS